MILNYIIPEICGMFKKLLHIWNDTRLPSPLVKMLRWTWTEPKNPMPDAYKTLYGPIQLFPNKTKFLDTKMLILLAYIL